MQPTRASRLRAARTQPAFRRPSARRRCPGARNRWRIDRQAQRCSRAPRSTPSPRLSRNTLRSSVGHPLKRVQRTGRTGLECCVIDLGVERPMHGLRNHLLVAVMALASSSLVMLAGQQTPSAGRYTGAQAAAGRTVYQMQCSSCHQPDLKGQGEAPPLAGSEFIEAWGRRSPRELLAFMQLTMPPARPGGLSEEEYVNITAFILQSNGAPAGNQALTAATEVAINTVATGRAPTTAPPAQGQRGGAPAAAGGGGRGRGAAAPPVGITVEGEVKNYVPVTDAMLRSADPGDKLFAATSEADMIALDARTGKTVWQTTIGDRSKGSYGTSSGPIVAKGKLIQGLGGCSIYREEKCFISAYDTATGKEVWRFYTVGRQGEPGGDTWGALPNLFRAGGETWITGSYDPALNLTFWGTAQAKPWMPISRGMSSKDDALFTSSTLALDVDTGKLAWHFQHAPAETLDLDVVFERVLVDDNNQNLLFTVGKDGILWKLDRKTGKYLGHKETVFQNVWDRFDPQTGRPHYRSDILEQRFGEWVQGCPSTEGGHNWPESSHHAGTSQFIIPHSTW